MTPRDALLQAVRGLTPGTPVLVDAGWVLAVLASPEATVQVDLTTAKVAELLGRDSDTVTAWARTGLLPGCWKLNGREWRIPATSLQAFLAREGRPI